MYVLFLQAQFAEQSAESAEKIIATTQSALQGDSQSGDQEKPHTLEQFSMDHFLPLKKTLSRTLSRAGFRKGKESDLWSFSRVSELVYSSYIVFCTQVALHGFAWFTYIGEILYRMISIFV